MHILGVDGGFTRSNPTGIAVVGFDDGARLIHHTLARPRMAAPWEERVAEVLSVVAAETEACRPHAIAVEMPHARLNARTAIQLATIVGGCVEIARRQGVPCQMVQPSQAKKALTRSGTATKQQMIASARALFGVTLPKDAADAAGVALAGAALLGWFAHMSRSA